MRKLGRIISVLIGIALMISGIYQIYTAFTNNDSDKDKNIIDTSAKIGDIVSNSEGVAFRVLSVDNVKNVGSGMFEEVTEDNYIVISLEISNNSNEPYDVNVLRFALVCDGKEYQCDDNALLTVDNHMYMDTVNPDLSKEYSLLYEVPTTTDESEYVLKIEPVGFSDKDSVYITLKQNN